MKYLIKEIESFGAKLVREGSDLDFLLLDVKKRDKIKDFLLLKGFILFQEDEYSLNFKKYINAKLIDIDIDIDIDTLFVKQFFYDVSTNTELKEKYYENPQKYTPCVNTLRYMLLLRGFNKKYLDFFYKNKEFIIQNNYCLKYLDKTIFRKDFKDFNAFLRVVKRNKLNMFLYIRFEYILRYYKVKFLKKRAKLISFLGIDGSGKSTIIDIVSKDFGYKTIYLGDRSIKFSKLYQIKWLKPLSIFIQYFEKLFRVGYWKFLTFRGKNIITDRYYFEFRGNSFKSKIYGFLYNKLFIKPDLAIVFYNDADVILSRKKEVTKKEIENFNKNIDKLPFENMMKIKNDSLDDTLNQILKVLT